MDASSQLFLLHYEGNESEPRSISQLLAYRGEAEEAVAALAPAECHYIQGVARFVAGKILMCSNRAIALYAPIGHEALLYPSSC
ncbi:hypothetical protein KSD_20520 [Ktedonobacter sp. SOSP1-85]|nr:hypothetical protein KSD_20520 [Ktedonobacter sp. SOSP1-85]